MTAPYQSQPKNPREESAVLSTSSRTTTTSRSDEGVASAAQVINIAIGKLAPQVSDVPSMVDLGTLLESLDQEHIYYDWQLGLISCAQYEMLGVPIGLVSSIRQCLAEREQQPNTNIDDDSLPPKDTVIVRKDIPLQQPLRRDSMSVYEGVQDQDDDEEEDPSILRLPSLNPSSTDDTAYRYRHWPPRQPVRVPSQEPGLLPRRSTMSSISFLSGITLDDPSLFGDDNNRDDENEIPDSATRQSTLIPPMSLGEDLMIQDYLRMVLEGQIDSSIPSEAKRLEQIRWFLMNGVSIQNRRYRFRQYKSCFVASELVDFMVQTGLADTRSDAVWLGQALQFRFQWYHHVVDQHVFSDAYLFFRFQQNRNKNVSKTKPAATQLARLSEEYHSEDTTNSSGRGSESLAG